MHILEPSLYIPCSLKHLIETLLLVFVPFRSSRMCPSTQGDDPP